MFEHAKLESNDEPFLNTNYLSSSRVRQTTQDSVSLRSSLSDYGADMRA